MITLGKVSELIVGGKKLVYSLKDSNKQNIVDVKPNTKYKNAKKIPLLYYETSNILTSVCEVLLAVM